MNFISPVEIYKEIIYSVTWRYNNKPNNRSYPTVYSIIYEFIFLILW